MKKIELRLEAAKLASYMIGSNVNKVKFTLLAEEIFAFLSEGLDNPDVSDEVGALLPPCFPAGKMVEIS